MNLTSILTREVTETTIKNCFNYAGNNIVLINEENLQLAQLSSILKQLTNEII